MVEPSDKRPRSAEDGTGPDALRPGHAGAEPSAGPWPDGWQASGPCRDLRFGASTGLHEGEVPMPVIGLELTIPGHDTPFPVAARLLVDDVDGLFGLELRAGMHHATLREAALSLGPASVDDVGLHEIATPSGRVRVDDLDRVVVILAHPRDDSC